MKKSKLFFGGLEIILFSLLSLTCVAQQQVQSAQPNPASIRVEYVLGARSLDQVTEIPKFNENVSGNTTLTVYRNKFYQVTIAEINRGDLLSHCCFSLSFWL